MAVFRDYKPFENDRAAEDRRRHRQLVEDTIKKNLPHILSEEGIIGQNMGKKIKIPIRGLKEYRFVYGNGSPTVVSGDGSEKRGDRIGRTQPNDQGEGNHGAGNTEGEDIYETEITLGEIVDYLFEDLNLPNLDKKKYSEIITEGSNKRSGYQRYGIPPRLAKKRTVIEKLKRRQAVKRAHKEAGIEEKNERFPFKEEDLRYHRVKPAIRKESNAVIFCIMDTSASMDQTRKFLARTFYFLMYHFVIRKYINVEVVFIAHSTVAKIVTEQEFFHKVQSGGTYISSGYKAALEEIEKRFDPSNWNIYVFHASDGDNWSEDNQEAVKAASELCEKCNLFGYIEIKPYFSKSTIKEKLTKNIKSPKFATETIINDDDIWRAFKNILKTGIEEG